MNCQFNDKKWPQISIVCNPNIWILLIPNAKIASHGHHRKLSQIKDGLFSPWNHHILFIENKARETPVEEKNYLNCSILIWINWWGICMCVCKFIFILLSLDTNFIIIIWANKGTFLCRRVYIFIPAVDTTKIFLKTGIFHFGFLNEKCVQVVWITVKTSVWVY